MLSTVEICVKLQMTKTSEMCYNEEDTLDGYYSILQKYHHPNRNWNSVLFHLLLPSVFLLLFKNSIAAAFCRWVRHQDPIKSESRFSTQPTNAASDKPPDAANTGSPGSCSAAAANINAGSSASVQPDRCSAAGTAARSAATASAGDFSRCHGR